LLFKALFSILGTAVATVTRQKFYQTNAKADKKQNNFVSWFAASLFNLATVSMSGGEPEPAV